MNRQNATPHTRSLVIGLLQATVAGALLLTWGALPAAAEATKIQRLPDGYKLDDRLVAISSKGPQVKRCVGASVGNFAILTSYECLADWWSNKNDYSVRYASDAKREHFFGVFERAHRDVNGSRWAILETFGHSAGYYGYESLDLVRDVTSEAFDFVGFSKKVKRGHELAIQSQCRLTRTSPGRYTSECGRDFDASGILILRSTGGHRYVSGLARVQSQAKTGKQLLFTLDVVSRGEYGSKLGDLRRDQDARYAANVAQREVALAGHRAASAEDEAEAEAARARRAARRQADLEKFTAAMGELGAALGGARRPVAPPISSPSPAPLPQRPNLPTSPVGQRATGPTRWECGEQTRCVGGARAELPQNGMAQLRLVDSQSNVLAYMNVYWTSLGPANSINQRRLSVSVGIGSTSSCQLTSDIGFYVNGRIETFLGGVGTGPEVASMEYRKVTRQFYIPDGATVTVGPGAAYCAGSR
jgi:hypothetical protein